MSACTVVSTGWASCVEMPELVRVHPEKTRFGRTQKAFRRTLRKTKASPVSTCVASVLLLYLSFVSARFTVWWKTKPDQGCVVFPFPVQSSAVEVLTFDMHICEYGGIHFISVLCKM